MICTRLSIYFGRDFYTYINTGSLLDKYMTHKNAASDSLFQLPRSRRWSVRARLAAALAAILQRNQFNGDSPSFYYTCQLTLLYYFAKTNE